MGRNVDAKQGGESFLSECSAWIPMKDTCHGSRVTCYYGPYCLIDTDGGTSFFRGARLLSQPSSRLDKGGETTCES